MSEELISTPEQQDRWVAELASSIRAIAQGGVAGPGGLEGLAMSISGKGTPGDSSLVEALEGISCSLESIATSNDKIAEALHRMADAIREHE